MKTKHECNPNFNRIKPNIRLYLLTLFGVVIRVLFFTATLYCTSIDKNAGTCGFQFLKINNSARAFAMGEAFCAISGDINSVWLNPAGLAPVDTPAASFSHNSWLSKIQLQAVSYIHPIRQGDSTFGASILYLHMDKFTGYDIDAYGEPVKIPEFTCYDLEGILTYSKKLTANIFTGLNLKLIQEKLETQNSFAVATDLGVVYKIDHWLKNSAIGTAIQNLGKATEFIDKAERLPLNFNLGCSYNLIAQSPNRLITALDINKPIDNNLYFNFGAEYNFMKIIAIRTGYNTKNNFGPGISAGIGFKTKNLVIDYAFIPYGKVGNSHRVSLTLTFGKGVARKKVPEEKKLSLQEARQQIKLEDCINEGIKLFHSGDYQSAIVKFKEANTLNPDETKAKSQIEEINKKLIALNDDATLCYNNNQFVEAISKWEELLSKCPHYPKILEAIKSAKLKIDAQEKEKRAEYLKQLLRKGSEYYNQGNIDKAVFEWRKVLSLEPENKEAVELTKKVKDTLFDTATQHLNNGELQKGLETYERIIKIDPTDKTALQLFNNTKTEFEEKIKKRAEKAAEEYNNGNYDTAIKEWEGLLKTGTYSEEVKNNLTKAKLYKGIMYYRAEKLTDAVNCWAEILKLDPQNEKAQVYLARAKKKLESIEVLKKEE
ncbi:MAG: PorV/PorQ family protein [Elusimicrobiota bacterium]